MKFKKLWNNRIFRTFIQTIVATITAYFMTNNIFDIESKAIFGLLISAISTGVAKVMPLLDEEVDNDGHER